MLGEELVVERAWSQPLEVLESLHARHAEVGERGGHDEVRTVEPHAAMHEHDVPAAHEVGHHAPEGLQLAQAGQALVEDGVVDVEHAVRNLG